MSNEKKEDRWVQFGEKTEDRWVKFGKWVKRERMAIVSKTSGEPMTQDEAARRAGISRVHWARIEAGATGVKYASIRGIARALGRTTEDGAKEVYRRAGFSAETEPFELPPQLRHFSELPEELQAVIARQIDEIYLIVKEGKEAEARAREAKAAKGRGKK